MPILKLLTPNEQKKFDSSPQLSLQQKQKFFALNDDVEDWLYVIRKSVNKVGFLIQLGYFRASGKFFPYEQFRKEDIAYVCALLSVATVHFINSPVKQAVLLGLVWECYCIINIQRT